MAIFCATLYKHSHDRTLTLAITL